MFVVLTMIQTRHMCPNNVQVASKTRLNTIPKRTINFKYFSTMEKDHIRLNLSSNITNHIMVHKILLIC